MGKPGPDTEYTESEVLTLFNQRPDPCEPLTASETADELGCSRATAYNLLTELSDKGDLDSKKVGAKGRVWWVPSSDMDDD